MGLFFGVFSRTKAHNSGIKKKCILNLLLHNNQIWRLDILQALYHSIIRVGVKKPF